MFAPGRLVVNKNDFMKNKNKRRSNKTEVIFLAGVIDNHGIIKFKCSISYSKEQNDKHRRQSVNDPGKKR